MLNRVLPSQIAMSSQLYLVKLGMITIPEFYHPSLSIMLTYISVLTSFIQKTDNFRSHRSAQNEWHIF